MDQSSLLRLADRGLGAFPPERLTDLAAWCRDWVDATGDGRYCSVAQALERIGAPFESDELLSTATVRRLDLVLQQELPAIVRAETAEIGALLARAMRERLADISP